MGPVTSVTRPARCLAASAALTCLLVFQYWFGPVNNGAIVNRAKPILEDQEARKSSRRGEAACRAGDRGNRPKGWPPERPHQRPAYSAAVEMVPRWVLHRRQSPTVMLPSHACPDCLQTHWLCASRTILANSWDRLATLQLRSGLAWPCLAI